MEGRFWKLSGAKIILEWGGVDGRRKNLAKRLDY